MNDQDNTHLQKDGKKHLKKQLEFEQKYLQDLKKIKQDETEENLENGRRRYLNKEIEKTKNKIQKLDEKLEEVEQ